MFVQNLVLALFPFTPDSHLQVVAGSTMACDDFYEAQGRLDGAFCEYSVEDKFAFLQRAHELGVKNIEMESASFAAFCQRAGVHAAVVCAALLVSWEREEGDGDLSLPLPLLLCRTG